MAAREDLYFYHMWDYRTPLYDIMEGLNCMVRAGKTRYIGISNCFAWQLAKANALAEKEGFAKFVSAQGIMTEIALTWLVAKVMSPIVGATKLNYIEGAAKAADLVLTEEEVFYLEEPYVPNSLVDVMVQNTRFGTKEK